MSYKGQPVPSTVYQSYRAKVSDGQSVRVPVPEKTKIESQKLYLLSGYFGAATESVTTGDGETSEVILTIEQAEYETDQIDKTQAFEVGTLVYWDVDNSQLTETDTDNRLVGRVSSAKDASNVIWFILGPQV
jgi:predicted RecA/RadA family phage recombinase